MPRRIAQSTLNASTIDIMNVIRQNASYEYQQSIPEVTHWTDIPKVGEIIYGTPAFANQFINALVNRIAMVRVQSANFNNPYSILKKGYIEFGETIEDIFVNIAKVVDYNVEKADSREFKRSMPDVRSAFHTMNWRVMYPVTIQDEDLRMAFLTAQGVQDLISKIVDSVYTAAEYDEFLLFKYLMIKAITKGQVHSEYLGASPTMNETAFAFRSTSNILPFMSSEYNVAHVKTSTPKDRQIIFMDANFNAQYDVEVLASAFNMNKADFMGRLFLIDNWASFDNERFEVIRSASDGLEEVTGYELAQMAKVKAVILDENWFQVYDNNNKFTEKYVASGLYWNYFYHTWKTVSSSPFANAVVFYLNDALTDESSVKFEVTNVDKLDGVATTFTLDYVDTSTSQTTMRNHDYEFVQTETLTEAGIAVNKYGAFIVPATALSETVDIKVKMGNSTYTASNVDLSTFITIGNDITIQKDT